MNGARGADVAEGVGDAGEVYLDRVGGDDCQKKLLVRFGYGRISFGEGKEMLGKQYTVPSHAGHFGDL